MKRGDIVPIYEDPYTKQKPEGKARLISLAHKDPEFERWYVRFLEDTQSYAPNYLRVIVPD